MNFKTENIDGIMVVEIGLDVIDAGNAKEFKTKIFDIIKDSNKAIFNMTLVNFLDSSGCGALLSCLRKLNSAGGDLKLFGVQESIMTVFELVRMHRIIGMYNTKEEAVNAF